MSRGVYSMLQCFGHKNEFNEGLLYNNYSMLPTKGIIRPRLVSAIVGHLCNWWQRYPRVGPAIIARRHGYTDTRYISMAVSWQTTSVSYAREVGSIQVIDVCGTRSSRRLQTRRADKALIAAWLIIALTAPCTVCIFKAAGRCWQAPSRTYFVPAR